MRTAEACDLLCALLVVVGSGACVFLELQVQPRSAEAAHGRYSELSSIRTSPFGTLSATSAALHAENTARSCAGLPLAVTAVT